MKWLRIQLKTMIKSVLFLLSKKNINLKNNSINRINVSKDSLSVFSLSTNPIISFEVDGELFFFRECHKICKEQDSFENAIVRFFDFIELQKVNKGIFKEKISIKITFSEEEITKFKEYIYNKKEERQFYRKIVKTDRISEKNGFNIWSTRSYDNKFFSEYGMGDISLELFDIAILFLWHMRSTFILFRTKKISTYGEYSFFNAGKMISSKIVAEEFGIPHMIIDAKPVYLSIDNSIQLFGILTPKAPGYRARDLQISPNSLLQRELHNLYLLDIICSQTDHGPDNYNIYYNGEECCVNAFDNDNPYTFSPLPHIRSNIQGCLPRTENGIIYPIADGSVFKKIININYETLKNRLKPYLNCLQIKSLICRIKRIRKVMLKAHKYGSLTVINNDVWSEEDLQMELNGAYGETYLTVLMKKTVDLLES